VAALPVELAVDLTLTATAAAVSLAAGWLRRRRNPSLDGERWFKLTLATLIRGQVEADGGAARAWEDRVLAEVPYHPAGRLPEQKITNPAAEPPGALLDGEAGLLASLRRREGAAARWAWLYDEDEHGIAARLDDPFELGPRYQPNTVVPGLDWDAIARWGVDTQPVHEALLRHAGTTWVWITDDADGRIGPALAELVADLHRLQAAPRDALVEALADLVEVRDRRLVLFAEGDAVPAMLEVLAAHAGLRDRVVAVVSVGGVIGGRTDRDDGPLSEEVRADWMGHWFGQKKLDTDEVRLTPYLSMQWLDRDAWPPGIEGQPLQHQRFPEPSDQGVQLHTIESVDLGPIPVAGGPSDRTIAKALLFVVSAWVVARR